MLDRQTHNLRIPASSVVTFLLLWSLVAVGQMKTRSVSGTVTDHQHEPLKGAVVEVENDATMGVVSYITDRDGNYSFKRLDGGTDYRMWVNFRGRKSKVRPLSQFDSNRSKIVNFRLNLH